MNTVKFSEIHDLSNFHPVRRGTTYIGPACCGRLKLKAQIIDGEETIITECPDHASVMIQDGRFVGTAA